MGKARLIPVGGFLGAGKTTLALEAARRLTACGLKVGLITNDHAPDLVDTAVFSAQGFAVSEVVGNRLCCNFEGFLGAAEKLRRRSQADFLFAEPLGSCVDLSATVLQPLKARFAHEFDTAPLSVLVDPGRLEEVLGLKPSRLRESTLYIVRKQLEEADFIVLNKVDLLSRERAGEFVALLEQRFPGMAVRSLSALSGEGVDAWLEAVLAGGPGGKKVADMDYEAYGDGESILGWLNAAIRLEASEAGVDWKAFSKELLQGLAERLRAQGSAIGHLKLLLSAGGRTCFASLTRIDDEISVRGEIPAGTVGAALILNVRAVIEPEALERIVREELERAARGRIACEIHELRSLRPSRPKPACRYSEVAQG